jgi:hypothetical protein
MFLIAICWLIEGFICSALHGREGGEFTAKEVKNV